MRRTVSVMILTLLLVGAFMLPFNVRLVRAQAATTVYINSDGSVSPSSAPISSVDNVTYTFTGNVSYPAYSGIVVERNNTVIDGNGYTVQGNYSGLPTMPFSGFYGGLVGFYLAGTTNVTVENVTIEDLYYGIDLENSNNNVIEWTHATANLWSGIFLNSSSNNVVRLNNATANQAAIYLLGSSNNNVSKNTVTTYTHIGIFLGSSSNNTISGNNAIGNGGGICLGGSSNNNAISDNIAEGDGDGISLTDSSNCAINGNIAAGDSYGINLGGSNNIVIGNNVTDDYFGMELDYSSNDTISGNNVEANSHDGIYLYECSNDILDGNNVTANGVGIGVTSSSNETIYHNSFINNLVQVSSDGSPNKWDNGYPSGGNYWSDYSGTDQYSGPHQNVTGSDGIGDIPYNINANNTDNYPLMGAFSDFSVAEGVDVQVVSNSTVSNFQFNGTAIIFNVSGANGTTGFCNVRIPTSLLNGTLTVLVNGTQVQYSLLPSSNSTISYIYFIYGHSTEQVTILPEFPDSLILAMFMLATLLSIAIHKKKHSLS
jgi:parallel beta-helix repeat protein